MLTKLIIRLKHSVPWLWRVIEQANGWLFGLRYPHLRSVAAAVLSNANNSKFNFSLVSSQDIEQLSAMMLSMPADYLKHFNPHKFDVKSFKRLLSNKSFVLMKAQDRESGELAGYFFLRGFVIGRAFHGLVTSPIFSGQGLGTEMWRLGAEICQNARIPMFATISKENIPSLTSANKALDVHKIKDMDDQYMLFRMCGLTASG